MVKLMDDCRSIKKQMAFQLARQQINLEVEDSELSDCINNTHLSKHFIALARELDVLEPKVPEDIYKSHLETHSMWFKTTHVISQHSD